MGDQRRPAKIQQVTKTQPDPFRRCIEREFHQIPVGMIQTDQASVPDLLLHIIGGHDLHSCKDPHRKLLFPNDCTQLLKALMHRI